MNLMVDDVKELLFIFKITIIILGKQGFLKVLIF